MKNNSVKSGKNTSEIKKKVIKHYMRAVAMVVSLTLFSTVALASAVEDPTQNISKALTYIFDLIGVVFIGMGGIKALFGWADFSNSMDSHDSASKTKAKSSIVGGLMLALGSTFVTVLINLVMS